ncbi:fatty-acid amide hydrolase 2-B [Brachyhypopomus gauderio]|uniref:fatty-acid amide hydrolase 2-B n=1 Tax=Brachyhypopomus gauderio TaxID=698409 RepID=UPI004042A76B
MALTAGERTLRWLFQTFTGVLYALFRLLTGRRSGGTLKLPPIRNPLLKLSAVKLAEKIRKREVSSVEVVQAFIDRIQEVNPHLNAMVKDRFSGALSDAAQADRLIEEETGGEEALQDRLPLLGVPLSVKESLFLQGMPCSVGLISRAGVISSGDAPPVALLKRAGAIPLGVTNTSELCMWVEGNNRLHGVTNNPYDTGRTSGGSSGGEGSILGSGASVIGIGSDIGGSIRIPCFFNGIFGHKPTPGVVSNVGQYPPSSGLHDDYLSVGPMCRYAEDLHLMMRIIAGANADKLSLSSEVDLKKLRFFTIVDDGGSPLISPVDKQLIQAQRKVVQKLEEDLGVQVKEVSFPQLKNTFQIFDTFLTLPDKDGKLPPSLVELMSDGGPRVWPVWELIKWCFGKCDHTMAAIFASLIKSSGSAAPPQFILQQKEALQREMDELLGTDGVLLYPSHPLLAPRHHHLLFTPFNFCYTAIFNILGLPVSQCPLGLSEEGLPLGVQVVAGKLQDHLTLAMARYLEKAFGGWREPGAI